MFSFGYVCVCLGGAVFGPKENDKQLVFSLVVLSCYGATYQNKPCAFTAGLGGQQQSIYCTQM